MQKKTTEKESGDTPILYYRDPVTSHLIPCTVVEIREKDNAVILAAMEDIENG